MTKVTPAIYWSPPPPVYAGAPLTARELCASFTAGGPRPRGSRRHAWEKTDASGDRATALDAYATSPLTYPSTTALAASTAGVGGGGAGAVPGNTTRGLHDGLIRYRLANSETDIGPGQVFTQPGTYHVVAYLTPPADGTEEEVEASASAGGRGGEGAGPVRKLTYGDADGVDPYAFEEDEPYYPGTGTGSKGRRPPGLPSSDEFGPLSAGNYTYASVTVPVTVILRGPDDAYR